MTMRFLNRKIVKLCGSLTVCILCSIGVVFAVIGVGLTFTRLDKPGSCFATSAFYSPFLPSVLKNVIGCCCGSAERVLFSWFVGELQMQLLWFGFYPPIFCCLYNRFVHTQTFLQNNFFLDDDGCAV